MHARASASLVITAPVAQLGGPQTASNYRVLMVQRRAGGSFSSALVFPGGVQETGEDAWACAVRETHEETNLRVSGACARSLGRWVTPRAQKLRFDTRFFLAHLRDPRELLNVRPRAGEISSVRWVAPTEALALNRQGLLALFPPQFCILHAMGRVGMWQELARRLEYFDDVAVEPVVCARSDGRVVAVLPGDWAYPVDGAGVADALLFGDGVAAGRAVNRLVMDRAAQGGFDNIRLVRTAGDARL